MQKCSRCNNDVKVTYSCDHTNNLEMCSECYQQTSLGNDLTNLCGIFLYSHTVN